MKTMYVDKRSELTLSMKSLEIVGMRCYRIKTQCGCTEQGNIRFIFILCFTLVILHNQSKYHIFALWIWTGKRIR